MKINLPSEILAELEAGAALAVSISGGKDSLAMLSALTREHRERGWPGRLVAVHADLGRFEWGETPAVVREHAARFGVELVVVRRERGDLLDRIKERFEKIGKDKPFWPSSAARYCTSDSKRGPIEKYLRTFDHVVSAVGIRAQESAHRANAPEWRRLDRIWTRTRRAFTWNPLLKWSEDDVWAENGTSRLDLVRRRMLWRGGLALRALDGWPAHPAYVYGNERLSCAICVLASRADIENGARHNPDLLAELVELEKRSGWTFRQDLELGTLFKPEQLSLLEA